MVVQPFTTKLTSFSVGKQLTNSLYLTDSALVMNPFRAPATKGVAVVAVGQGTLAVTCQSYVDGTVVNGS